MSTLYWNVNNLRNLLKYDNRNLISFQQNLWLMNHLFWKIMYEICYFIYSVTFLAYFALHLCYSESGSRACPVLPCRSSYEPHHSVCIWTSRGSLAVQQRTCGTTATTWWLRVASGRLSPVCSLYLMQWRPSRYQGLLYAFSVNLLWLDQLCGDNSTPPADHCRWAITRGHSLWWYGPRRLCVSDDVDGCFCSTVVLNHLQIHRQCFDSVGWMTGKAWGLLNVLLQQFIDVHYLRDAPAYGSCGDT